MKAFTMIELIFIIIILGILTAIAVPALQDINSKTPFQEEKDKGIQKQSVEDRQNDTRENW